MSAPPTPPPDSPPRCAPVAAFVALALAIFNGHYVRTVTTPEAGPSFAGFAYLGGLHPLHAHAAQRARDSGWLCGYDHAVQAGVPHGQLVELEGRLVAAAALLPLCDSHRAAMVAATVVALAGTWAAGRLLGGAWAGTLSLAAVTGWFWWSTGADWLRNGALTRLALIGLVPLQLATWERSRAGWNCRLFAAAALTHALGFFLHPPLWTALLACEVAFWLGTARRESCGWTAGHTVTLLIAGGANVLTVREWWRYWWIRSPLIEHGLTDALHDRAFLGRWPGLQGAAAVLAGLFALGLLFVALQRLTSAFQRGRRLIAFGIIAQGIGVAWAAAIVPGEAPPGLTAVAATCFVAAFAGLAVALLRRCRDDWRLLGSIVGATLAAVGLGASTLLPWLRTLPPPDAAGIPARVTADDEALVAALRSHTDGSARIVWEERAVATPTGRWDRLLPDLTGRAFVGSGHFDGLECDAVTLRDGHLGGRGLDHWLDEELTTFCKRLNVGWVLARTPESVERWGRLPGAYAAARSDAGGWVLYQLARPHGWCLRGTAAVEWLPGGRVVLSDVKPEHGALVLSLHSQDGLLIEPHSVKAEPELDAGDPIPLIRLKLDGPFERITLRWRLP